jgi:hypothetical protein
MRSLSIVVLWIATTLLASCGGASVTPSPTAAPPAAPAPTEAPAAPAPTEAPAAPAPTEAPAAPELLRVITPFLSLTDPAKGGGFNAVQFGIGETLMRLDDTFMPVPWLAASSLRSMQQPGGSCCVKASCSTIRHRSTPLP